jgi:glutamate synthase (NADPH) small chain
LVSKKQKKIMGNPTGFITIKRKAGGYRPIQERVHDYAEVERALNTEERMLQASRCMDCGIPFCQWGCPVVNIIPEFNDAIYRGEWKKAIEILHSTNNFPEFTGKICPAPCEHSCVLNIHEEPVTIRQNESAIIERAWQDGHVKPNPPAVRTGKKVAVIGSGPAGMAAADQLNKAGHEVTLFEKDNAIGGLLRYGIPDFKLNKYTIERRVKLMEDEGIKMQTNTFVGKDILGQEIMDKFDAVCLAVGAMKPRDLTVEGRNLEGVHFAMDFLTQQNKKVRGERIDPDFLISAKGKDVLVIGGGDTGSDCVGNSIRQGANSVTQVEIMPKPALARTDDDPWPYYSWQLKTSSSHEEGCERHWSLATKEFIAAGNAVKAAKVVEVEWQKDDHGKMKMVEKTGSEKEIKADLILLAMGFVSPVHEGLLDELKVGYTQRNNVDVKDFQTKVPKVFSAGDAVMGASLVVRAIYSGRQCAEEMDKFLQGS